MVRQSTRGNLVRVGGRIIRKPRSLRDQARFDSLVRSRGGLAGEQSLRKEAIRLDQEFRTVTAGNINDLKESLESIPKDIRRFMTVTIDGIDNRQKERITDIEQAIVKGSKERRIFDDRDDTAKFKGAVAKVRGLMNGLERLKKGEIVSVDSIKAVAKELGAQATTKRILKEKRKSRKSSVKRDENILKTGNITSINFETGRVVVDGKTIKLRPSEVKGLKLSSVRRASSKPKKKEKITVAKVKDSILNTKVTFKKLTKLEAIAIQTKRRKQSVKSRLEQFKKFGLVGPNISQQQQATTLRFEKDISNFLNKPQAQVRKDKISFSLKKTNIRRIVKGETLVHSVFGPSIVQKNGTIRVLTPLEKQELQGDAGITNLNPLNIGAGFIGASASMGHFARNPNKLDTIKKVVSNIASNPSGIINGIIQSLIDNPFYSLCRLNNFFIS